MVLEGGAFGRYLGLKSGDLINVISVLIKEISQSPLSTHVRTKKSATKHRVLTWYPYLGLPASRTVSNKFLLFVIAVVFCYGSSNKLKHSI